MTDLLKTFERMAQPVGASGTAPDTGSGRRPAWNIFAAQAALFAAALAMIVVLRLSPGALLTGSASAAAGDAARGARLFAKLPCASCHDITRRWPGGDICPNLGNAATEAARIIRLPDYHGKATDAAGYLRESIVNPNAYIVPGANYRTEDGHSVMPKDFAQTLTASEIADLVAYLLTRR